MTSMKNCNECKVKKVKKPRKSKKTKCSKKTQNKKLPSKKSKNKKKSPKTKLTRKKAIKLYNLLKVIEKLSTSDFNILSQYLDENAYNILAECIQNTICSQSIDEKTRSNLRKVLWSKKSKIRYLADKSKPYSRKKKIIPQIGGNIGLIIGTVLPLIYNFLRSKKII